MLNLKLIIKILGFLLIVEGVAMLMAFAVAALYNGPDMLPLVQSAAICLAGGSAAVFFTRNAEKAMRKNEGFIIVSLVWIVFSLFGSLPYLISRSIPDFTDAFFETMSGFTTTGSSILNDIESLPKGILFWRSMTQWLGGMGIIVLSLAILPVFGIGGMQLFAAEVPGPITDKLNPRISQTAKNLWGIYILFTAVETVLLRLGGMSLFDAVNHSFTTMATGGYSTKQASIAYWGSAYIQYTITVFTFIAGANFTLSYAALSGRFSRVYRDEEFKYYFLFVLCFILLISGGLLLSSSLGIEETFRQAIFQVVTIITTTGYATTDYLLWPSFLTYLLFAAFFFGGCAGSTGGGIKIMRIVLLMKNSYYELRRMLHPNAVIPVRLNGRAVSDPIITNVLAFFMIYIIIFFSGSILLTIVEPDLESTMGAVATSLGNIGPGLGKYGPSTNFYELHPVGKWVMSFLMLLGRLELFTVLVLFSPSFWKK